MNPVMARAALRLIAIAWEGLNQTLNWATPGSVEGFLFNPELEPLFFLLISEGWFWIDEKRKNKA